jgi:hypothetical protein
MNTARTKEIRRFVKSRRPKNTDLPDPGVFTNGVNDPDILALLGRLVAEWPHLEERMVYIFGLLTGTEGGLSREIFRTIISQEVRNKIMKHALEETVQNADKPAFFDKVLSEFASLNTSRNKYVHGLWMCNDEATYLATSEAARHPFETVTRKVNAAELRAFLSRMGSLSHAIITFEMKQSLGEQLPVPKEFLERLLEGRF